MSIDSATREELILRDHLALDRTRLANERTLLAYIRTAFMFCLAGATALKLFAESASVAISAWLFIGLGVVVAAFGIGRFVVVRRAINRRANSP